MAQSREISMKVNMVCSVQVLLCLILLLSVVKFCSGSSDFSFGFQIEPFPTCRYEEILSFFGGFTAKSTNRLEVNERVKIFRATYRQLSYKSSKIMKRKVDEKKLISLKGNELNEAEIFTTSTIQAEETMLKHSGYVYIHYDNIWVASDVSVHEKRETQDRELLDLRKLYYMFYQLMEYNVEFDDAACNGDNEGDNVSFLRCFVTRFNKENISFILSVLGLARAAYVVLTSTVMSAARSILDSLLRLSRASYALLMSTVTSGVRLILDCTDTVLFCHSLSRRRLFLYTSSTCSGKNNYAGDEYTGRVVWVYDIVIGRVWIKGFGEIVFFIMFSHQDMSIRKIDEETLHSWSVMKANTRVDGWFEPIRTGKISMLARKYALSKRDNVLLTINIGVVEPSFWEAHIIIVTRYNLSKDIPMVVMMRCAMTLAVLGLVIWIENRKETKYLKNGCAVKAVYHVIYDWMYVVIDYFSIGKNRRRNIYPMVVHGIWKSESNDRTLREEYLDNSKNNDDGSVFLVENRHTIKKLSYYGDKYFARSISAEVEWLFREAVRLRKMEMVTYQLVRLNGI